MLDINRLTLGEIAKIEELSQQSITVIGEEASPKGLMLAALAFVTKRRENNNYKWNDALGLNFEEANEILGLNVSTDDDADEDVPEDPTEPEPTPEP